MRPNEGDQERMAPVLEKELIQKLDRAAGRLSFLSEVSRVLSEALTDRECFQRLLALVIPYVADWGTLSLVNADGSISRVATHHRDPEKAKILSEIEGKYGLSLDDPAGPGYAIREGKAEFDPSFDWDPSKNLYWQKYPRLGEIVRTMGVRSRIA